MEQLFKSLFKLFGLMSLLTIGLICVCYMFLFFIYSIKLMHDFLKLEPVDYGFSSGVLAASMALNFIEDYRRKKNVNR